MFISDPPGRSLGILYIRIVFTIVQPLVRPWPEAKGCVSGRPSSRPVQGAAARSGGQGRRRLAPGPEPRAATHRPVWAEHGEHGEDPPLARSEHRGTCCICLVIPVIHALRGQLSEELTDKLSGCPAKCPWFSLQSARGFPCKVPVDKSLIHMLSPGNARACQGICTMMPVRPFTGGGLRRRIIPRPSSLMSAARYWLCTTHSVCRNTALKLSMRS
jgi:hypothetical protein